MGIYHACCLQAIGWVQSAKGAKGGWFPSLGILQDGEDMNMK